MSAMASILHGFRNTLLKRTITSKDGSPPNVIEFVAVRNSFCIRGSHENFERPFEYTKSNEVIQWLKNRQKYWSELEASTGA